METVADPVIIRPCFNQLWVIKFNFIDIANDQSRTHVQKKTAYTGI